MTEQENSSSNDTSSDEKPPPMRRRMRRWRIAAWIFLGVFGAIVAGYAGLGLYDVWTTSRHPGFSAFGTITAPTVVVGIGGRQYRVPENYFFAPPRRSGREQQNLLLQVLWPNLEGRTEENWADFRVGNSGNKIRVLLGTAKSKISAQRGVENARKVRMKNDQPLEYRRKIDGFDHYFPVAGNSMIGRNEYFIRKAGNRDDHFIECKPDGAVPYPGCTHWFPLADLIWVRVSYGKQHFPQWREIQAAVIALMQRFETAAQLLSPPTDR
jgi:hypothetical protein